MTTREIEAGLLERAAGRKCRIHAVTLDPETGCDYCEKPETIRAGDLTDEHRGRQATYLYSGMWELIVIGSLDCHEHDGWTFVEIAPGHQVLPGLKVTVYPEGWER